GAGSVQPGGVHQDQLVVLLRADAADRVARGLWLARGDRDLLPDQGVGQGRLAGVGPPDQAGKTGTVCRGLGWLLDATRVRVLGVGVGLAHVRSSASWSAPAGPGLCPSSSTPGSAGSGTGSASGPTRCTSTVATRRRRPAIRSAVRRSPASSAQEPTIGTMPISAPSSPPTESTSSVSSSTPNISARSSTGIV